MAWVYCDTYAGRVLWLACLSSLKSTRRRCTRATNSWRRRGTGDVATHPHPKLNTTNSIRNRRARFTTSWPRRKTRLSAGKLTGSCVNPL